MAEHRTQFAFKGKREHIAKVNMLIIAYLNQHIDIEILHGSRDRVIVPDTIKIMFNVDIESSVEARNIMNNVGSIMNKARSIMNNVGRIMNKARSIMNNVDRALIKKKVFMLGSKDIDTINNSDIYDTYKDL